MKITKLLVVFITVWLFTGFGKSIGQSPDWEIDKMPVDLETDFALSALPPHLRQQATLYLLDPKKGYYIVRQGKNGFTAFVVRTEWEQSEFSNETFSAISFDAEGSKTLVPVFLAAAQLRASGKYTPAQVREILIKRIKDGTYKGPSRPGISYMLAPMMRTHPGTKEIVSMIMPHYMFYAPNLTNADIGGLPGSQYPFVLGSDAGLNDGHAIFNYIILPAGEAEKARIVEENKDLLSRLVDFKPTLKVDAGAMHH